ncbi:YlbE-like family protein [Caldibacillus lycopersici]|uniref:YlbE-like family protein n=1 Tax=Perspicuibacillus lycopersici TaxID=1325689 RepID=A0AAE3IUB3_9BACI|nr:YlbE-like family protein [Perspicuibacillus lycopersici]MCU9612225.1 YlbE-like family protein [Perspicuibacillus lycopersici]
MRKDIYDYIKSKKDLHQFIREQPIWYKNLARNPHDIEKFERAALHYYRKTIPDRVEKISNNMQMASMMIGMLQAMNQKD